MSSSTLCFHRSAAMLPRRNISLSLAKSMRSVPKMPKATAWDSWSAYLQKNRSNSAPTAVADAPNFSSEIAAAIAAAAAGHKPKFAVQVPDTSNVPPLKLVCLHDMKLDTFPEDLHDCLEVVGLLQLKNLLGVEDLDAVSASFTTTDINAALNISALSVESNGDKSAEVVLVATETERTTSWSRLEGLLLHWACTDSPGGAWGLPPQGWKAYPSNIKDAGGAWQCVFEKQKLPGNKAVYVTMLQIPLRGILKSGGLVFVLKATEGQNTRWLKNAKTTEDFFFDLQKLPVVKA